jgi:GTP-binding protein
LFNRLAGRRHALVADTPGVTRDRKEAEAHLRGRLVRLIDTAGLEEAPPDSLAGRMRASSESAFAQADLILFVIDARQGVTQADTHFAQFLRRTDKPVLVVANKAEGRAGAAAALEAYSLGLGEPVAVSAEHNEGIADLMLEIAERLPEAVADEATDPDRPLKLAIVGRPNAGKSTLINRLLGEERMLVGPEPGLTRDAVATLLSDGQGLIELVDTAGLRKKARIEAALEKMSVSASLEALKMAEVVVLAIDATEGVHEQDLQIARLIEREGRACVLALTKWDAVADRNATRKAISDRLEISLAQMKGIPSVTLSGLTGAGVEKLLARARHLEQAPADGGTQPLVRGRHGTPPAAAGAGAPAEASVYDAAEGAAADVPDFRHAGGAAAGGLSALSGEWAADAF